MSIILAQEWKAEISEHLFPGLQSEES